MIEEIENKINKVGFNFQDFFALKEGIKPVLRSGIEYENINYIKEFCEKYKLSFLIKPVQSVLNNIDISTYPRYLLYISLSSNMAKEAFEAEKNKNTRKLGKLLGYPECCIDFYMNTVIKKKFPFPIYSFIGTKGKLYFYANNIFNLDTRLGSKDREIISENPDFLIKIPQFYLIWHLPCSFNCKKSIKIGKEVLKALEDKVPVLAEKIVDALKRPFLFIDDFNWIVFDGKVKENEIIYKNILPYKSLFPKEKIELIRKGDKIKVFDDEILIFKDENSIGKILKEDNYKGVIMDFS